MKKNIVRAGALILAAALLTAGCGSAPAPSAPELLEPVAVAMDTEKAVRGELTSVTYVEGAVTAVTEQLFFPADGIIGEVNCYPGQWVEEGDLLFAVDQSELHEQIASLEEEIEEKETLGDYDDRIAAIDIALADEAGDTYGKKQAELALAEAKELREVELKDLRAKLKRLKDSSGNAEIRAPFSGHVAFEEGVSAGSAVQAGLTVAVISNPADLKLVFPVYLTENRLQAARYYARIRGTDYELSLMDKSREEMMSELLSGGQITSAFRITGVRESGDAGEYEEAKAGDFAVLLLEYVLSEDCVMVPQGAVYSQGDESYVYVINGGTREKRPVTEGRDNGYMIEIKEGLEEGEVVYVSD